MLNQIQIMKKSILFIFLLMAATVSFAQRDLSFVVEGPEMTYNQIKVVNETSLSHFNCRIVLLNNDKSVKEVYGVFELAAEGESDTSTNNANRVKKGSLLGIQFQKSFTADVSFFVEYKDYPFFDVIIIHLIDPDSEYE